MTVIWNNSWSYESMSNIVKLELKETFEKMDNEKVKK